MAASSVGTTWSCNGEVKQLNNVSAVLVIAYFSVVHMMWTMFKANIQHFTNPTVTVFFQCLYLTQIYLCLSPSKALCLLSCYPAFLTVKISV